MADETTSRHAEAVRLAKKALSDEHIRAIRDSLPQGASRVEVRDDIVEDLYVRIGPQKQTWWLRTHKGKVRLGEWGVSPADISHHAARQLALEKLRDSPTKPKGGTFGEVIEAYIKLALPSLAKSTQKEWTWRLDKYLSAELRDAPLDNVMGFREAARKMLDAQRDRPALHNKNVTVLKRIFRWGRGRDLVPQALYLDGIDKIGTKPRARLWSDAEMVALLSRVQSLPVEWRCFFVLVFYCGFRVGTALALEWNWYNEEKRVILLPSGATKGRESEDRTVAFPVIGTVEKALALQREITGAKTFINGDPAGREDRPRTSIQKAVWKMQEAVEDFRCHDARRYVTSTLAQLRVPSDTVERVLLHRLQGVRAVYDVYGYTELMREALEAYEAYIVGIVADARHQRYAEWGEFWAEGENFWAEEPEGE